MKSPVHPLSIIVGNSDACIHDQHNGAKNNTDQHCHASTIEAVYSPVSGSTYA